MPATAAAIHADRPGAPRRFRPAAHRHRRTTPPRAPRGAGRASVEPLESRVLLAADAGVFDASFGVNGKVKFDVSGMQDKAIWVRSLPDGKILVSGITTKSVLVGDRGGSHLESGLGRFIARLNSDGSFDDTFGEEGVVRLNFFSDSNALAIQPDGKILVGGTGTTDDRSFGVARFNPDGTVDAGFGDRGVAVANMYTAPASAPLYEFVTSLAVQPDGKVIAAGHVDQPGGAQVLPSKAGGGVVRFNSDGTIDQSFGLHVDDVNMLPKEVLLEPDGHIVVGGNGHVESQHPTGGLRFVRFNGDGTLDPSFGQDGLASMDLPAASDSLYFADMTDLLLQPDGKLVAVGNIGPSFFGIVRLNPNGTRDSAFGMNGAVLGKGVQVAFDGEPEGAYRLRYDPAGGTLHVAGVGCGLEPVTRTDLTKPPLRRPTGIQVFSAQLGGDGSVISAGRALNLPMAGAEMMAAATIQDDGRIVGAGRAYPTVDAGEGPAYDQTADALLVRFDPAALPAVSDALSFTPAPASPAGGTTFFNTGGSGSPTDALTARDQAPVTSFLYVTFAGRTAVRGGKAYPFRITYPNEGLARQTPVNVTGPGGFSGAAAALKVLVLGKGRARGAAAAGGGSTVRPAVASYRVPAPGGRFDAADNGTYSVRLNATAGAATSGQVVGLVNVNAGRAGGAAAPSPLRRLELPSTGVLRSTASVAGNATGWVLDRADAGAAGEVVDLDLSRFPGEAAALSGRLVTVVGSYRQESHAGRGVVSVFVVESIAAAM